MSASPLSTTKLSMPEICATIDHLKKQVAIIAGSLSSLTLEELQNTYPLWKKETRRIFIRLNIDTIDTKTNQSLAHSYWCSNIIIVQKQLPKEIKRALTQITDIEASLEEEYTQIMKHLDETYEASTNGILKFHSAINTALVMK